MASVGISGGRGGQLGGGGGGAATTTARSYHCYECERTVTILVTSQLICPNCNGVALEEFGTPPPSPPLPGSSSADLIEPRVFFRGYADYDSDGELSEPLPPPPPPPLCFFTATPRTAHRHRYQGSSQSTIRGIPSAPPSPPPMLPSWNSFFSPEEIRHNQYNGVDREFDRLPPPPPPIPEIFSQLPPSAPPLLDSAGEFSDSEFEIEISDFHLPPPPPPPPLTTTTASHLPPPSSSWDYFFPFIPEPDESNSDRHSSGRSVQMPILPPPPPPWFRPDQPPAEEGLPDRKMTEELVLDWESCQCAVCIDGFELNQIVKQMPCKHIFHSACISPWLDNHKSCPVCRYKL